MQNFRFINNIAGWIVFAISLTVYLFTLEPSVSFWDCGEFIASSYKLQIGHPPGAPFYQLVGRFFSLLSPSIEYVAFTMNAFSALSSAATIMFLYWTITHLVKRTDLISTDRKNTVLTISAGTVGALSFAFTDSFWFSAVESEVYAFSSLFTAVVFWAILKWEEQASKPRANRWLVLIAYLIGLSIGVHLLNLLAIPAIALIWYFKKYKITAKGVLLTLAVSVAILVFIMYGIVQGSPAIAQKIEVFFVNSLKMPFNSGIIFFLLLIATTVVGVVLYSHKNHKPILNLIALSIAVIYIGFGSYAMIIIRSSANPPMNENAPENAYTLMKYLNRSQYGSAPIFKGQYYNAPPIGLKPGKTSYYVKDGRYVKTESPGNYIFDERFTTFFPRMYSAQPNHEQGYNVWGKIKGKSMNIEGRSEYVPTFTENLRFFFSYQLNHMYIRYFMWNFSGRQNNKQGHGDIFNGNWLSGIGFIDKARLGHKGIQPVALSNPETTNRYFMLPFILGLIGLFYHHKANKKDFWVVMLLFFMTGIAIILYLNQTPYQPRERDYAYVGSFFAFSIWIGFGVLSVYKVLEKLIKGKALIPAIILAGIVPLILLSQNYDDHDRSGRYFVRDLGKNYLNSCEDNAIIFTYGDNDTFPLWYAQDVENCRTDVRVCNVTLLNSDWYIDQMKEQKYNSEPLPISLEREKYEYDVRNTIFIRDDIKRPVELSKLMAIALSDEPRAKLHTQSGDSYNYFPSRQIKISVDKQQVIESGTVSAEMAHLIADSVVFNINGRYISKSDLIVLNMLANNNWEQPVYLNLSVVQTTNIKLDKYLWNEGFAYRFLPLKNDSDKVQIDTGMLYQRLMHQFDWGNINDPRVFIDEDHYRTIELLRIKDSFLQLSAKLIEEGENSKAIKAINKVYEILPLEKFYTSYTDVLLASAYYELKEFNKGDELILKTAINSIDIMNFYLSLGANYINSYQRNIDRETAIVKEVLKVAEKADRKELSKDIQDALDGILAGL
jgi:hypothetical protein